ncbi:angio-associated migratory cell protein-like [Acanthaster planci]|uniref:Angio-associated migratory cell protein n=1 Tax=Acanthaster planci TaxID=133434 RepID=A0A8B7XH15_ACAPL|nr:angio-associated migratory cell protein-like [Acanthaster planci]XP_022079231.1 angio-associated migratory cell protein-like [Acanthaster planci]XP_022079232.1 angio-associated migratory cell protein-like [Acanthaster planci]XP_022079233.1 angio-associated migratory cell protein-like [Acanthaster planci]
MDPDGDSDGCYDDTAEEDMAEVVDLDAAEGEYAIDDLGEADSEDFDREDEEGEEEAQGMDGPPEEDVEDDADFVYEKHTASVFCCDLEPTKSALAVTGGEDDKAYVWKIGDGQPVLECSGHKDSVTCVGFSYDGSLVVSGDMSGLIKVWKVDTQEEIWSFECSDLEWLSWHHSSLVLLGGTSEGQIWMWKVPSGECKTMQGHGCQTTCGKIFPDGKKCCAGYEDGTVKIWDLKDTTAIHTIKDSTGHSSGVTSVDCHRNNIVVLTGSVDGTAKVFNGNNAKVLATFSAGAVKPEIGDSNSVEAVGLCQSQSLAAVGSLNGILGVWDIPTQKQRHCCQLEAGIVRLRWDPSGTPTIFTAGLDGQVQLWDARSGQSVASWTGHRGEILDVAISNDGNTILTASGDTSCRVFSLQRPER